MFESIIKVTIEDPPEKRARDIAEGIDYACAILMDEYGWDADRISDVLTRAEDNVRDEEESRRV